MAQVVCPGEPSDTISLLASPVNIISLELTGYITKSLNTIKVLQSTLYVIGPLEEANANRARRSFYG